MASYTSCSCGRQLDASGRMPAVRSHGIHLWRQAARLQAADRNRSTNHSSPDVINNRRCLCTIFALNAASTLNMGDENLIEDAAFIDLVQPRPWLYDLDNLKYKDNRYKDKTWQLVADGMGWQGRFL